MRKTYKVGTFGVTETCNNGNERTFKKKIYFSPFVGNRNRTDAQIWSEGVDILRGEYYYDIELISVSVEHLEVVE